VLQEQGNAAQPGADGSGLMDSAQLRRFIQHYERLTRQALKLMPQRAHALIRLGPQHEWLELRLR
jgi:D-glycerate 3-kinase